MCLTKNVEKYRIMLNMKRVVAFIFVFLAIFSFGCTKEPSVKVVAISFSAEFLQTKIYLNDEVDVSETYVVVRYSNNKIETISLDKLGINSVDTSKSGKCSLRILYKEFLADLEYYIYEPVVINANFSQNIVVYIGEPISVESYSMSVLYDNGDIENVSFDKCTISDVDYTLTENSKILNVTYKGYTKQVSYSVTYRKIVSNEAYVLEDRTGYISSGYVAVVNNGMLNIYESSDLNNIYLSKGITEGGHNSYTMSWSSGGKLIQAILTLQNGVLVVEPYVSQ